MVNQANNFKDQADKDKYLDAAARFRLPYWDPIMPRNERAPGERLDTVWGLPQLFKQKDVFVRTPASPKDFTQIENPMYCFKFPTKDEWKENRQTPRKKLNMPNNFNQEETVRTPGKDGKTDNNFLNQVIQRQASSLATKMWKMLNPNEFDVSVRTKAKIMVNELRPWNSFANDTVFSANVGEERFATVSVESWHDGIHNMIGTGQVRDVTGQMGNARFAGFEPMFWMHHCNIDRLLSLYQALYGRNVGSEQVRNELFPFMKNLERKCFTSADDAVKNYWSPGFGVPGSQDVDTKIVQNTVKQYLTDTYYWATNNADGKNALPNWPKNLSGSEALHGTKAKTVATPHLELRALKLEAAQPLLVAREIPLEAEMTPEHQDTPIKATQVMEHAAAVNDTLPDKVITAPEIESKPVMQIWDAHIKVRKFAFDGSFNVHVFIGWVKDDRRSVS
jgi:hypothetical protein